MATRHLNFSRLNDLCKNSDLFDLWLKELGLKLDFSKVECVYCGALFRLVKDSSYPEGECWKCENRQCRKKLSVKFGSWFEGAHLSYEQAVKVTYCWIRKISNENAAHECDVSKKSVVDWYNFCREVCVDILETPYVQQKDGIFDEIDLGMIGGEGIVVEIDESKFGKRYQHKGRHVDGVWVFGGIKAENKKNCFFEVVEFRDATTLLSIIRKRIRPGSIIYSDCWKAYSQIPQLPEGYHQATVQ